MKLTSGLAVSLAVLVTGLYTWGISTDPEGFRGLIRDRSLAIEGAVPLSAVAAIDGEDGKSLTWEDVAGSVSQAVVFKLTPPAAATLDQDFLVFRDTLIRAIAARDTAGVLLLSAGHNMVVVEASEALVGLEELLSSDQSEKIWSQLESVMAKPAARAADGSYCAPWVSCLSMPQEAGLVEPFETVFVTGENIPVYARPSEMSEQLVTLSFDAVRLAAPIDDAKWLEVALPADRTGFIARERVTMMFDTRVDFERLASGEWAMTSLVIVP